MLHIGYLDHVGNRVPLGLFSQVISYSRGWRKSKMLYSPKINTDILASYKINVEVLDRLEHLYLIFEKIKFNELDF